MAEKGKIQGLVRAAQNGDRAALERLTGEYRPRLRKMIDFRLGGALSRATDVEDVLQETELRSLESIQRFRYDGEESFFRWLTGIADKVILELARKERRRRPEALDADVPGSQTSQSRVLARGERLERLRGALSELSEDHRQAIMLAIIGGLPLVEAEALAQDLRRLVRGDPVEARAPSMWEKTARRLWKQRRIALVAGAALILALLTLAVSNTLIARARDRAEYDLYVSNVRLAMEDWKSGNYLRFTQLLDRHATESGDTDLRGWEWYYLDGLRDRELVALSGHSAGVTSLAWSPVKETRLASGSSDGTVRIWDASSQTETRRLEYGSPVRAVAWSPDAERLAVVGAEGGVRIWNNRSRDEPEALGPDSTELRAVAWSPDGEWLASGAMSGRVTIWDVSTGESREIRDDSDPRQSGVFTLEFSPDGQRLAVGVRGWNVASIFVWDTATWGQPREVAAVLSAIALSWSPDGRSLAMGTWDHDFTVWNTETWDESARLVGHSGSVSSLSWSPDGQWLASGAFEIKIWNTASWEELHTLRGHSGYVSVSWSPDGQWLASGSKDGAVRLWDPFEEQDAVALPGRTRVALSPDGRWLAANGLPEEGQTEGFVQIFDAATREPVASGCAVSEGSETHGGGHWSYSFSPIDSRLLAWASARGYGDSRFGVWDWRDDREVFSIEVDRNVRCSAWSPDALLVAIGGSGKATILDASSGRLVRTCGPDKNPGRRVETKPSGGESIWEAVDRLSVIGVAWSHDGSRFAAAPLGIWETTTWTQVAPVPPGDWRWVAWSPDDERLAVAGNDGAIAVCDARGRVLHETQGHPSLVRSIVWSPDGRRLASGAHDRTVKIWDASNLAELLTLRGHTENVLTLAWHRSGRWLVSGGPDCVKIWDAPGYEPARR